MTRLKIEIAIVAVLLIALVTLGFLWKTERTERIRTKANQDALLTDVKRYKTADSLNVLEVGQLTLTNREFKQHNSNLLETVNKLNLKVRRLESASETGVVTTTPVKTVIKDSIVYRDNAPVVLKCIDFSDGWVSALGCAENGVFNGSIVSRDTLQQFADRIPRQFLFIKWGTKGFSQIVLSSNPHSKIAYHNVIMFKK